MYKNQLQELAQRSCFNLPSYASIRQGPDHAPRFKASVTFNGETFVGPSNCTTLRQAEHAAAEVALSSLSNRGPSKSLTAKVLDETGVYKNLLQETAHRAGLKLPVYTTTRSGPGHSPVFSSMVELAGMSFSGEPAKTKKQAEKNAAMAAWASLKQMPDLGSNHHQQNHQVKEIQPSNEEQESVVVARVLSNFKPKEDKISLKKTPNSGLIDTARSSSPLKSKPNQHQLRPFETISFPKPTYQNTPKFVPPLHFNHQLDDKEKHVTPQFRNNFGSGRPNLDQKISFSPRQFGNLGSIQVPTLICRGGYNHTPAMAPMVQVRSVIPVFAARPSPTTKREEGEVSTASSNLSKLQL
ncbi:hypothetical protein LUZ62_063155 [Rhynchospora pubera]|uniref:DRBM domain-containing protein n=1 Tax=Rhynchospora pubera TaxID=906938 RepID=A0AAV8EK86_9POAL|nr:hypothetical protein LUZ62_063155 [Rhynchospora pubera]